MGQRLLDHLPIDHAADDLATRRTRLAALLAEVAELLIPTAPPPPALHPKYADADHNPHGAPRPFLDAGRRGDFRTFRRARRVTALWADVVAAMEARGCTRAPRQRPTKQPDSDRALLEEMRPRTRSVRRAERDEMVSSPTAAVANDRAEFEPLETAHAGRAPAQDARR